jgi:Flp pilus assembly protein TadD
MGRVAEAEAVFRDLTNRRPEDAVHLSCLGRYLKENGRAAAAAPILERAVAAARAAIRRKPDDAKAQQDLGATLHDQGKADEAIAAFREAIRRKPDFADAHNGLAFPLLELGDIAGAMRSVREAPRLDPRHAPALSTLSETLLVAGRFGEAVPALERVADGRGLSAALMAHSKGLIPKARWLAAHVAPPAEPAADAPTGPTATDLVARALADDRPALAARIYELVLAASPARAGDLDTGHRYRAARAAARAGCGRDKDDPPLDQAERAELRRLASAG